MELVQPEAIVTVGISASGKSTFANAWVQAAPHWNRAEINRDMIRRELMRKDGNEFSWEKWNWKREKEVTIIATTAINNCVSNGYDIIVSDTNLNQARRIELIKQLTGMGFRVTVKDFPVTLEDAWKRDAKRPDGVGHSVIAEQYEKWLEYIGRKDAYPEYMSVFVANPNEQPKCILVDIDGTLAHMNGKRGAFEWEKVGLDDCDEAVVGIVNRYGVADDGSERGTYVIILSGRDGICEPQTRQWLYDNDIYFDRLIMRAPNDMRKDTIVKEEIFWRDIAPNYNVQFVIDDRPCVVRLWQRIGLKTFAVGNQHIEF